MTVTNVYEGFYDAWREAEKLATESNKDIKDAWNYWPTVARIRSRIYLKSKQNVSLSAVQYHLHKLTQEGLVQRSCLGGAGTYYPAELFFTELDRMVS